MKLWLLCFEKAQKKSVKGWSGWKGMFFFGKTNDECNIYKMGQMRDLFNHKIKIFWISQALGILCYIQHVIEWSRMNGKNLYTWTTKWSWCGHFLIITILMMFTRYECCRPMLLAWIAVYSLSQNYNKIEFFLWSQWCVLRMKENKNYVFFVYGYWFSVCQNDFAKFLIDRKLIDFGLRTCISKLCEVRWSTYQIFFYFF